MDLAALGTPVVTALTNATTGVPGLVTALVPLLSLFIGIKLMPKLVKKFAK